MSVSRSAVLVFLSAVLLTGSPLRAQPIERVIEGELLRDPTRPAGQSLTGVQHTGGQVPGGMELAERYRISFIRAGGSQPVAVVNNQTVTIGDEVNGARVMAISPDNVVLQVGDSERHITAWHSDAVRRPAAAGMEGMNPMQNEEATR